MSQVVDPILWQKVFWPHVTMWSKEREIIYSVEENRETFVTAGNKLG